MQNEGCAADLEMTIEDRIQSIDYHMEQIYNEHRQMVLLYPWVAVMLLKKEKTLESGIILPDHEQNKVVHEGIVLATWRDKVVDRGVIHRNSERVTRCEVLHSELKAGDHVLFQHWAGQPISGYDPLRFRVVRERDWHETKNGGILAKIEYSDRNTKAVTSLMEMVESNERYVGGIDIATGRLANNDDSDCCAVVADPKYRKLLEAQIDDRFIVVDRDAESLTLSGK